MQGMQGSFLVFKTIFRSDQSFLGLRFLFNNLCIIFSKYFLLDGSTFVLSKSWKKKKMQF